MKIIEVIDAFFASHPIILLLFQKSIVLLTILWIFGFAMILQPGGPEAKAQYWWPVVTFLCLAWIFYFM